MSQVLLVDDDPAVGLALARMLAASGYQVTRVESAQDGLSSAALAPPTAVVLDVRMPTVGGLEFLRSLRADDRFAAIPVAVLTGDYFLKDEALAEISALNACVWYKPLGLDELDAAMAGLIGGQPKSLSLES